MVCRKPFKNPKGRYRIGYYRATLGGRVLLHCTVDAWTEQEAIEMYQAMKSLGHYRHFESVEKMEEE